MGKRELILMVIFVALGVGVYQVTAPAAPADASGFSLSRLWQFARAHVQGPTERRTVTRTATLTPATDLTTVAVDDLRGVVIVEGSARGDIEVRLEAGLAGIDAQDLDAQEQALGLTLEATGATAHVRLSFAPSGRSPRHELRLALPQGLKVQLTGRGRAEVRGVAGLELDQYAGQLRTDSIVGPITGTLDNARVELGAGASLDLRTEHGRLRAEAPRQVTIAAERGSIELVQPAGQVTLKTDFARMEVRGTGGPVTVTGKGGVITLREVRHPLSIDADRLTVTAELEAPAASRIAITDDNVELLLPRQGGVQLEATVEGGDLRAPEGLSPVRTDRASTLTAAVAGGGPVIRVDVKQGDLRIRTRTAPGT
jgi:hypothetical protein